MNLKQVEYIVKIAEENNITRAAEKLFLTQPALNQQLLKLERELETPLFYRSRTSCRPTPEGEVYIQNAKKLLQIKKETYERIHDMTNNKKGHLTIGLTPSRGTLMFSEVYPEFHKLYSNVVVEPLEMNVHNQQRMIAQGELDLSFLTLTENQKTSDTYIPLYTEELVLAVPTLHPLHRFAAPPGQPLAEIDLSEVQYEPFVLMDKNSTLRVLIDEVFSQAGFVPNTLFETANTNTIVRMVKSSLCCGIIPRYHMAECADRMVCFSLKPKLTWELFACYKKHSYLSKPARKFVELAKDYWNQSSKL